MNPQRVGEHLEVIRTLMERAALYRRALAPTSLVTGAIGLGAAVLAYSQGIDTPRGFGVYWMVTGGVAIAAALLVVRRQALRAVEPFWTPPTRRVTRAMLPPLLAGLIAGVLMVQPAGREPLHVWWLPPIWMILYGCALHAAGFFMTRGIRWLGWLFVVGGGVGLAVLNTRTYASGMPSLLLAHAWMGAAFGGLHLLFGLYLWFTEKTSPAP